MEPQTEVDQLDPPTSAVIKARMDGIIQLMVYHLLRLRFRWPTGSQASVLRGPYVSWGLIPLAQWLTRQ